MAKKRDTLRFLGRGEGVFIHSGKNRGLQFRTVRLSISVILPFSSILSSEGKYYMFELKVVSA